MDTSAEYKLRRDMNTNLFSLEVIQLAYVSTVRNKVIEM